MADYHAILKRAIGALPEPTGEARRSVYEKARTALVNQLKSFDPPLSASEITQQRLQLEDAIRKVEAEAAKSILNQALNRTPTPPTRPPATTPPPTPVNTAPATAAPAPSGTSAPNTAPAPSGAPAPSAAGSAPPPKAPDPATARPSPAAADALKAPPAPPKAATPPSPPVRPAADKPTVERTAAEREPAARTSPQLVERPGTPDQAVPPARPARVAAEAKPLPSDPPAATGGPLKDVVDEADKLGATTAETARQAREALSAGVATGLVDEKPGPRGAGRRARRGGAGRRGREGGGQDGDEKPSRLPLLVGLSAAALVVAVAGGVVWTKRDDLAVLFGTDRQVPGQTARVNEKALAPKSTDRLAADGGAAAGGAPAKSGGDGVKVVTTQPITPDSGAAASPRTGAETTGGATPPALPRQPVPPVTQKASLLEEGVPGSSQSMVTEGKVVWQTTREPPQPGKQPVLMVKGRIEVPDRRLVLNLTVQPNVDASFPASHLIELRFEVPGDFDHKGISNVPGLILKSTEQARGDPLIGAAARISSNFFWIALSSPEADKVRNLSLLKERGWIDVPILYEDGRRAILTVEKAGAGDRVVAEAIEAWGQGG